MRADGLAQNVADLRRYQILTGGMPTERLKSGAGKLQAKQRPRRAEIFALPGRTPHPLLISRQTGRSLGRGPLI